MCRCRMKGGGDNLRDCGVRDSDLRGPSGTDLSVRKVSRAFGEIGEGGEEVDDGCWGIGGGEVLVGGEERTRVSAQGRERRQAELRTAITVTDQDGTSEVQDVSQTMPG